MSDTTYNGWKNYETWAVNLWLTNDPWSAEYLEEMCWQALEYADGNPKELFTADQIARGNLATQLKDEYEEAMPELEDVWADLLGAALGSVDWFEIAGCAIQNVRENAEAVR